MKRFGLFLIVVTALAVFTTTSANAADNHYGHGQVGHVLPAHRQYTSGHGPQYSYSGQGHTAPPIGHGYGRHGYSTPVYGHGDYAYPSYGHSGGGIRISTPHFGLRIGH